MAEKNATLKLLTIQSRLKAPKDKKNTFGGYSYRSCEGILEALKPLLKETESALLITDEVQLIGERFYIIATAKLLDAVTGELIAFARGYAREADNKKGMDDAQLTGSASSYARKYALNGLFAIDDNKDADTDEYAQQAREKPQKAQAKPQQAQKPKENKKRYYCSVCKKEMSETWYKQSIEKYGKAYCSAECKLTDERQQEGIQ